MKAIKLTCIALLLTLTISAQVKSDIEIETLGGYEYNYFKSPEQIRQNGSIFTEGELIESSYFQDISLDYDYSKKWQNNRIRFSVNPYTRLFYQNFKDSYWSLVGNAKYDYQLNKTMTLLAEASVKRMNRKGLDGAQDLLINPLGYTNFGARGGLEFQFSKNNKTKVMAFYNFKDFDKYGVRDLQYSESGIVLKTTQQFKHNDLKYRFGLQAYIKKRNYDTFNASNIITNGKRDWAYFQTTIFYEHPLSKSLSIKPSFVYYIRNDNDGDRSSFNQFGPSIGIKFDQKRTRVRSKFKYITRKYQSIDARDNNGLTGEKIRYNYFYFTLNIEQGLSENLLLVANVYSRIRTTNYSDIDARSFRGYRNQYVSLGFQLNF